MAMQLIASEIQQSANRTSLSTEFYDHVSEIIKIFRKQTHIFVKLSSSFLEPAEAYQEIKEKQNEGLELIKEYEEILVDDNLYIVIQRFIGRVKEIIQLTPNLHLAIVNFIANCLKKLELYLHKNVNTMSLYHVFSDILNILPSYFESKPFSPEKSKKTTIKGNSPFTQAKTSTTLDLILESYRKSFSLLSTLDIDETEYRAVFFSARDDRYKGTAFLESEMRYRNRFIKDEMSRYDQGYGVYVEKKKREKVHAKKKRISKIKRIMSLDEQTSITKIVTTKIRNSENDEISTFVAHSLKEISSNKSSYTPELKTITEIPEKSSVLQQTTYNFNKTREKSSKSTANKDDSGKKSYGKVREDEFQDFVNDIKTKGEFRMTKVLFGKDGKLELSPFTNELKEKNPVINGLKNKIIFRRAQENIRKKFNRIPTEPPSSNKPKQPKKNYTSTLHSESEHLSNEPQNQKNKKMTIFKEKEIKLMGIKGVNNKIKSNSFDDSEKFWSNNVSAYYMKKSDGKKGIF